MPLYFAYGSNMDAARLTERLAREGHTLACRRRGTAAGYRLVFNKRSSLEAHVGYANIEVCPGAVVEGTLNEIDETGLALLDRIELVPVHYERTTISVFDWGCRQPIDAFAYLAQPAMLDAGVKPTRDYVAHLLGGADLLPEAYVRSLLNLDCSR